MTTGRCRALASAAAQDPPKAVDSPSPQVAGSRFMELLDVLTDLARSGQLGPVANGATWATVTQALVRGDGEGAAYYAKQIAAGKTVKEALRLLKRRISDRIFRALLADETAGSQHDQPSSGPVKLAA